METDFWISAIIFGCVLLGGGLRHWWDWTKAKEAGEEFSKYKLQRMIITTFVGGILYFALTLLPFDFGGSAAALFGYCLLTTGQVFVAASKWSTMLENGWEGVKKISSVGDK